MAMTKTRKPRIFKRGELKVKYRQYIPYEEVANALKSGHDVFFSNLKRQTAYKAAKKLSRMVGKEVIAVPCEADGEKGYAFTLLYDYEKRIVEELYGPHVCDSC